MESSVPAASVWGLEHHHATISVIWGYIYRGWRETLSSGEKVGALEAARLLFRLGLHFLLEYS